MTLSAGDSGSTMDWSSWPPDLQHALAVTLWTFDPVRWWSRLSGSFHSYQYFTATVGKRGLEIFHFYLNVMRVVSICRLSSTGISISYFRLLSWWRHQMGTVSALLAFFVGNSPVTGEFPSQRPVTRSFDVFFDLRLNKRLSKQSWGWWFETPSRSLWRHRNDHFQIHTPRTLSSSSIIRASRQHIDAACPSSQSQYKLLHKYSLLMHCIKIKSPAKFLLNEQYVFVGGNIYFLCVLSCSSEEA